MHRRLMATSFHYTSKPTLGGGGGGGGRGGDLIEGQNFHSQNTERVILHRDFCQTLLSTVVNRSSVY